MRTISDWMRLHHRRRPGAEALVDQDGRLTYGQLAERTWGAARGLRDLGVKPGDRVGVLAGNTLYNAEMFFSVALSGGVYVAYNWRWAPAELAEGIAETGADVILVEERFENLLDTALEIYGSTHDRLPTVISEGVSTDALRVGTGPVDDVSSLDSPLCIIYTGGSTGRPKGVVLSQRAAAANALNEMIDCRLGSRPNERGLIVTPLFHSAALLCWLTTHFVAGATSVLAPRFDDDSLVDLVGRESITNTFMIPNMLRQLMDTGVLAEPVFREHLQAVHTGLTFIGPPAQAIATMGEKVAAREVAIAAEVPLAPGSDGVIDDAERIREFGAEHGYPVLVKASAGGGGRGMRRIDTAQDADEAFDAAVREATSAFGNGEVYLERYLTQARHVEVQVFADVHGNTIYLGDRDCSVQRRHQKLIEEAPAPGLSDTMRAEMGQAAVRLARQVGYVGAGTVEFMVDGDDFYFLEMNTRIQVEHPVTELVQGLDLVAEQIRVAAGGTLSITESGRPARGAAIEARINAEDVAGGRFVPSPGVVTNLTAPSGPGLRFDAGYESGDEVLPLYDSLVGKLIAWGPDRTAAIRRLQDALQRLRIEGVRKTAPAASLVLEHEDFREERFTTRWLETTVEFPEPDAPMQSDDTEDDDEEGGFDRQEVEVAGRLYTIPTFRDLVPGSGAPAALTESERAGNGTRPRSGSGRRRAKKASDGTVTAPMQGTIIKINVDEGQQVKTGELLFVLEAMKMENPVLSPADGTVGEVLVSIGQSLAAGTRLTSVALQEVAS